MLTSETGRTSVRSRSKRNSNPMGRARPRKFAF
jgi:hypothetical protein